MPNSFRHLSIQLKQEILKQVQDDGLCFVSFYSELNY